MNMLIKRDRVDGMILIVISSLLLSIQLISSQFHLFEVLRLGYGKMTNDEDRSYFSLWSISKSPLIIGTDIRKMSDVTLSIYSNPEVISINQDPLGIQGRKLKLFSSESSQRIDSLTFAFCSKLKIMSSRQQWIYSSNDQTIRSLFNGKCLTKENSSSNQFDLHQCSSNNSNQKWIFNEKDRTVRSFCQSQWFVSLEDQFEKIMTKETLILVCPLRKCRLKRFI